MADRIFHGSGQPRRPCRRASDLRQRRRARSMACRIPGGSQWEPGRDSWSEAKQSGWGFGSECYTEAQDFRESKARGGRASADARKAASGTAQPPEIPRFSNRLERCSNSARTHFRTHVEPANSQQPASNSQNEQSTGARIPVAEWEPLREHRDLCAIRRADCDLQLSRFRERNVGNLDTDQGWGVRFTQWIGRSRPERSVPPEAVASPTFDEWMSYAREVSRGKGPNGESWPKPLAEAGWHENQAKGWKFVQDWKADCNSRPCVGPGTRQPTSNETGRPDDRSDRNSCRLAGRVRRERSTVSTCRIQCPCCMTAWYLRWSTTPKF